MREENAYYIPKNKNCYVVEERNKAVLVLSRKSKNRLKSKPSRQPTMLTDTSKHHHFPFAGSSPSNKLTSDRSNRSNKVKSHYQTIVCEYGKELEK